MKGEKAVERIQQILTCAIIVFAIVTVIVGSTERREFAEVVAEQAAAIRVAVGERDNAVELAEQYKQQYNEAVLEIAELKRQNEELTRAFEETSFALNEVSYETGWAELGEFKISWYCPCYLCCGSNADGITATGTLATEGRTVAVDPHVIPLGSKVKIAGHVYIAEDTGVHGRVVDVFVDNHERALQLGIAKEFVAYKVVTT